MKIQLAFGFVVPLAIGCGGQANLGGWADAGGAGSDGSLPDGSAVDDAGAQPRDCIMTSTSSLPGVTIAFRAPVDCIFTLAQAAAGISIPYDVIVANDVANVVPTPQDVGHCERPGASGLILFERLASAWQNYCVCDTGYCGGGYLPAETLRAGTYGSAFAWDGKNWGGPSSTHNPEGAPFPAGVYTLVVSATGTYWGSTFTVSATLAIRLTGGGAPNQCEAANPWNFCEEGGGDTGPCTVQPGYHEGANEITPCASGFCCTPDPLCCRKGFPVEASTCRGGTCTCPAGYAAESPVGSTCN